jgi:hypothetical protein
MLKLFDLFPHQLIKVFKISEPSRFSNFFAPFFIDFQNIKPRIAPQKKNKPVFMPLN